ncbi:MAG: hypothetical protein C5B50_28500 [Verrucomicrobia bacterium]|nr:MAG: hypothetical protein C5B50_28500 [Verrucomicrobiota bacterium]
MVGCTDRLLVSKKVQSNGHEPGRSGAPKEAAPPGVQALERIFRVPIVEVGIFVAIVLVGWAAYSLNQAEAEVARLNNEIASRNKDKQFAAEINKAYAKAREMHRTSGASAQQAQQDLSDLLNDSLTLWSEYENIADRIHRESVPLERLLREAPSRNRAEGRPIRLDTLDTWIVSKREGDAFGALVAKSKQWKEQMVKAQEGATKGPLLTNDLETLMNGVDDSFRNYFHYYMAVLGTDKLEGKGSERNVLSEKAKQWLNAGQDEVKRLTELGRQARKDADAVTAFLKNQFAQQLQKQAEIGQILWEAPSAQEFAHRLGVHVSDREPDTSASASVRESLHILIAALVALGALVLIDSYRRHTVIPLRLRLAERDRLSEQRKKLERLEEVAATLAHEIRNPLTTIGARVHAIRKGFGDGSMEDKSASVIVKEIERVNRILSEFIQLTRPATPKLEVMSAGPLLEEVTDLMRPQLEDQGLELKLEPQANGKGLFFGDPQQLKQVLLNLVNNAAESMGEHGSVTLRARRSRTRLNGLETNVAMIEVQDTGPGIRPEVRERLFEPFFSTKSRGTGLGLPISARIVDRHNGELTFDTDPGHGTTFRIILPAYEQQ